MNNHAKGTSATSSETEKDFVVRLHNDGASKDEIAARYAKERHGRQSPTDADKRFVDEALTNLEG
ncbi:MAG TPA: hypothetical protein VHV55_05925 [Pirellulales bacterium]|jgi:hypothetical protein|nr:hypothetical protein [Pirellulales bacterium]